MLTLYTPFSNLIERLSQLNDSPASTIALGARYRPLAVIAVRVYGERLRAIAGQAGGRKNSASKQPDERPKRPAEKAR